MQTSNGYKLGTETHKHLQAKRRGRSGWSYKLHLLSITSHSTQDNTLLTHSETAYGSLKQTLVQHSLQQTVKPILVMKSFVVQAWLCLVMCMLVQYA